VNYETFSSWAQLLDHVAAGHKLYYQAPMDYTAHLVGAYIRKDGKVRVTPVYSDADPFTADTAHLPRFRRPVSRLASEQAS
jgi:hypothetical protein